MAFDASAFLNSTVNDASSTTMTPVEEGEYVALAKKVDVRQFTGTKDPSKTYTSLDVSWAIDDARQKEVTGMAEPQVRQSIMLDLTESGNLDMGKGKNVGLGRLREAIGLNQPGRPFSFSMIEGRPAKVFVTHRTDGDNIYAEIKKVAAL